MHADANNRGIYRCICALLPDLLCNWLVSLAIYWYLEVVTSIDPELWMIGSKVIAVGCRAAGSTVGHNLVIFLFTEFAFLPV